MLLVPLLGTASLLLAATVAEPSHDKRAHRHGGLSDQPHDDALSYQFDHEAFLGKKEAKTFDQLAPEESKERLGKIVDRIDTDGDGYISHEELYQWIKYRQETSFQDEVDRQWIEFDLNNDGQVTWEEYKNKTYGYFLDGKSSDAGEADSYTYMLAKDERRFKAADRNADGIATKEEMAAFLHPEMHEHMKDIAVKETVDDIDQNGDGLISLEEYLGDVTSHEDGETEPEWATMEKKDFLEIKDVNKDGVLDASEVAKWILPGGVDYADDEARHLLQEADKDQDGRLSLAEILDKTDLLLNTSVTDYGDLMAEAHDEL